MTEASILSDKARASRALISLDNIRHTSSEVELIIPQNVKNALMDLYTVMPLFAYEGSNAEEILFDNFDDLMDNNNFCAGAVLYNNEIDPSSPGFWGNDASVEEVLHTINACSHVEIYPDVFGLEPNSSEMSDAMDVARGGQFLSIPSNYPEEGWYHYDDWTCDYECMAMEYLYWCIVTNMGLLSGDQICQGIANEWELCTPQLFEETDILMHDLVTDIQNLLPQNAPEVFPESLAR